MPRGERFDARYEADDGYVGHRPQGTVIFSSDLEEDMTEDDLRTAFADAIMDDFSQKVTPAWSQEEEDRFVEWAKQQIEAMKKE